MRWDDNGSRFDVDLHGTITFTDDLTDVQSLSDGGSFQMRDWSGSIMPHTVKITASGGTLTREYFVGGLSRGWDDEGRRFLAGHLPVLVRRSGLGAESRVKSIYGSKGAGGVLDEVDRLMSDYARRLYLVALIDVAHPDSAGMLPIMQRAATRITSDYDKRGVLEHVASATKLDKPAALAFVQALATMKSDYDQRLSLTALTTSGAGLDGDAAFQAVAHMKGSYDKRLVLTEIIQRGGISVETKRGVIDAAAAMQNSDYDRRLVLTDYIQKYGIEPPVRSAFFTAVDAMRSDYDRAETLLAALKRQSVDAETRAAYVSSAERLKGQYDQNRVLAALARAESR